MQEISYHDKEKVTELFRVFVRTRDREVRKTLILINEPLVKSIAYHFARNYDQRQDLIQIGSIGLINAVDRFDPERGIKFSCFAVPHIMGEIRRHFRDNEWSFKVSRYLQDLGLLIDKIREPLMQKLGHNPSELEIAEAIGVSEEEAIEAICLYRFYRPGSIETEEGQDIAEDFDGEEDETISRIVINSEIEAAMAELSPKLRQAVRLYYWNGLSQTQIGKIANVHQMQISRRLKKAEARLAVLLSPKCEESLAA